MRKPLTLTLLVGMSLASALDLPALPPLPGLPALPSLPTVPSLPTYPRLPNLSDVQKPPPPAVGQPGKLPSSNDAPDYGGVRHLLSGLDTRLETVPKGKVPYLTLMDVDNFRTYQRNGEACRAQRVQGGAVDPQQCPKFEWQAPYGTVQDSQGVAKDLRQAWQRLEDRYYWRAMVELNNPAMLLTHCVVDLGTGLKTKAPTVKTNVPPGVIPKQLAGKIDVRQPHNDLNLDTYGLLPQVPNRDYCEGLTPALLPIMFLPGTCFYVLGVKTFCIEGTTQTLNPLAPRPIAFDHAEVQARLKRAIEKAHTTYLLDYQTDALKALFSKDRKFFFALPWRSNLPGEGAFVAPVMNTDTSLTQFTRLAQEVRNRLGGTVGANAAPYYFQFAYRSPTLNVHTLPGSKDVLRTPPGIWQLEEFKRTLGPSSLPYYELFGYSTFFQAWNELKTLTLPEPMAAKALRPILYYAFGNNVYLPSGTVPIPAPVPIEPYHLTGLPFAGPQMLFDWVSVPEGYSIPRVQGTPLFDYAPLLR